MVLPVLPCTRVVLRPFHADDRDALYAVFSDPITTRYWAYPAWTDPAQAADYLAPLVVPPAPDTTKLPWAIADRTTEQLIGTVTIFSLHREQGRAEIGYSLHRARWGQGLAREAVGRALAYGFDELALRRFEADIDPRNTSSIHLVQRFGFAAEGVMRERWLVNDELCDSAMFGLLARDFRR